MAKCFVIHFIVLLINSLTAYEIGLTLNEMDKIYSKLLNLPPADGVIIKEEKITKDSDLVISLQQLEMAIFYSDIMQIFKSFGDVSEFGKFRQKEIYEGKWKDFKQLLTTINDDQRLETSKLCELWKFWHELGETFANEFELVIKKRINPDVNAVECSQIENIGRILVFPLKMQIFENDIKLAHFSAIMFLMQPQKESELRIRIGGLTKPGNFIGDFSQFFGTARLKFETNFAHRLRLWHITGNVEKIAEVKMITATLFGADILERIEFHQPVTMALEHVDDGRLAVEYAKMIFSDYSDKYELKLSARMLFGRIWTIFTKVHSLKQTKKAQNKKPHKNLAKIEQLWNEQANALMEHFINVDDGKLGQIYEFWHKLAILNNKIWKNVDYELVLKQIGNLQQIKHQILPIIRVELIDEHCETMAKLFESENAFSECLKKSRIDGTGTRQRLLEFLVSKLDADGQSLEWNAFLSFQNIGKLLRINLTAEEVNQLQIKNYVKFLDLDTDETESKKMHLLLDLLAFYQCRSTPNLACLEQNNGEEQQKKGGEAPEEEINEEDVDIHLLMVSYKNLLLLERPCNAMAKERMTVDSALFVHKTELRRLLNLVGTMKDGQKPNLKRAAVQIEVEAARADFFARPTATEEKLKSICRIKAFSDKIVHNGTLNESPQWKDELKKIIGIFYLFENDETSGRKLLNPDDCEHSQFVNAILAELNKSPMVEMIHIFTIVSLTQSVRDFAEFVVRNAYSLPKTRFYTHIDDSERIHFYNLILATDDPNQALMNEAILSLKLLINSAKTLETAQSVSDAEIAMPKAQTFAVLNILEIFSTKFVPFQMLCPTVYYLNFLKNKQKNPAQKWAAPLKCLLEDLGETFTNLRMVLAGEHFEFVYEYLREHSDQTKDGPAGSDQKINELIRILKEKSLAIARLGLLRLFGHYLRFLSADDLCQQMNERMAADISVWMRWLQRQQSDRWKGAGGEEIVRESFEILWLYYRIKYDSFKCQYLPPEEVAQFSYQLLENHLTKEAKSEDGNNVKEQFDRKIKESLKKIHKIVDKWSDKRARLLISGSFLLGSYTFCSDVDLICLVPRKTVTQMDFFANNQTICMAGKCTPPSNDTNRSLYCRLCTNANVRGLVKINYGTVFLIKFEFDGIEFDLTFVSIPSRKDLPVQINDESIKSFLDKFASGNADDAKMLRVLSSYRSVRYVANLLSLDTANGDWTRILNDDAAGGGHQSEHQKSSKISKKFRNLLLSLKLWAKITTECAQEQMTLHVQLNESFLPSGRFTDWIIVGTTTRPECRLKGNGELRYIVQIAVLKDPCATKMTAPGVFQNTLRIASFPGLILSDDLNFEFASFQHDNFKQFASLVFFPHHRIGSQCSAVLLGNCPATISSSPDEFANTANAAEQIRGQFGSCGGGNVRGQRLDAAKRQSNGRNGAATEGRGRQNWHGESSESAAAAAAQQERKDAAESAVNGDNDDFDVSNQWEERRGNSLSSNLLVVMCGFLALFWLAVCFWPCFTASNSSGPPEGPPPLFRNWTRAALRPATRSDGSRERVGTDWRAHTANSDSTAIVTNQSAGSAAVGCHGRFLPYGGAEPGAAFSAFPSGSAAFIDQFKRTTPPNSIRRDNETIRGEFNAAACRSITEIYRTAEMKLKSMMQESEGGGNGKPARGGGRGEYSTPKKLEPLKERGNLLISCVNKIRGYGSRKLTEQEILRWRQLIRNDANFQNRVFESVSEEDLMRICELPQYRVLFTKLKWIQIMGCIAEEILDPPDEQNGNGGRQRNDSTETVRRMKPLPALPGPSKFGSNAAAPSQLHKAFNHPNASLKIFVGNVGGVAER
ncbi:hypothetical protein GPALN_005234 [Globodera pallida]|nr:hypothetical protein GPALN_005234 [Globodera pallida]